MKRPDFDSIKSYEEFKKYQWNRQELKGICREHGLLFVGSEKKLHKVIESYFNGVKIPPRRNWYTNPVLQDIVNENGVLLPVLIGIFAVSVILLVIGIVNKARGTDSLYYVPCLVFGVTGLVLAVPGIQVDRTFDVIKSFGPLCGDKRFTRTRVDEQANSDDTEYMPFPGIFLAPDMLIGTSAGVTAVAYEDISSIRVRQTWHTERKGSGNEDYYIYKIVIRTNRGKRIVICKSRQDPDPVVKMIYDHCLEHNPNVKLLDMRKSPLASDDTGTQVTSGKGVRNAVEKAWWDKHLTRITEDVDLKERFISYQRRAALILIPEAFLVAFIAAGILLFLRFVLHIAGINMFMLVCLLFPGYAVYNLIKTLITISKNDFDFYTGEVIFTTERGCRIKGVDYYYFGYIKKMKPDKEPKEGDTVIIARFGDEFSLIS